MNKEQHAVDSHFSNKDQVVRRIYDRVLKTIQQIGPVIEDSKKTSIHLVNGTALAGVATRKDSLILTIKSDRKLASPRVHKSEQVSTNRFHHEVKLRSPDDVDEELIGWLRDAYELNSNRNR